MRYEGVNFNEEAVKVLSQEDFVAIHIEAFWRDRDRKTRKMMLTQVYGLITKPVVDEKSEALP